MKLNQAKTNIEYEILSIKCEEEHVCTRLLNLGFVAGKKVILKRKAPIFKDPLLFQVGSSQIALTDLEAKYIEVTD
jgi:Fe2+ transport system protein FeoA